MIYLYIKQQIKIFANSGYLQRMTGGIRMKITDIMKERMTFSFEVFPPKEHQPMEPLLETLDHLYGFKPDFISCTYGAGGTNAGRNMEICKAIKDSRQTIQ